MTLKFTQLLFKFVLTFCSLFLFSICIGFLLSHSLFFFLFPFAFRIYSQTEIVVLLNEQWRNASVEIRQRFQEQGRVLKRQWDRDMLDYNRRKVGDVNRVDYNSNNANSSNNNQLIYNNNVQLSQQYSNSQLHNQTNQVPRMMASSSSSSSSSSLASSLPPSSSSSPLSLTLGPSPFEQAVYLATTSAAAKTKTQMTDRVQCTTCSHSFHKNGYAMHARKCASVAASSSSSSSFSSSSSTSVNFLNLNMNSTTMNSNLHPTRMPSQPPKKRRRKKKNSNQPTRPLSGFMYFAKDKRNDLAQEHHIARTSIGEMGKLLGKVWNSMTVQQKEPYTNQCNVDKMRYIQEMKIYLSNNPQTAQSRNYYQKAYGKYLSERTCTA